MRDCPVPNCTPLPDCQTHDCPRCQHEDASERAAIQYDGSTMSAEAWRVAVELVKRERARGQRSLAV